jgi:putative transposase
MTIPILKPSLRRLSTSWFFRHASAPSKTRAHGTGFFRWYNTEHRHSGLGLHTPPDVHFGLTVVKRTARALVLTAAYAATLERFVNCPPTPALLPTAA